MMPFDRIEISLSFLRAIEQAEPVGLNTESATQALGTVHRNSIGSKTPIIKRQLTRHGYSPDEVYRRKRTPGGNFWHPGQELERRLPRWNRTGRLCYRIRGVAQQGPSGRATLLRGLARQRRLNPQHDLVTRHRVALRHCSCVDKPDSHALRT